MSDLFGIVMLTVIMFYVMAKAENYDDEISYSGDDEGEGTVESESKEIYKMTTTEKEEEFKEKNSENGNLIPDIPVQTANPIISNEIERETQRTNTYPYSVSIQKKGSHYATGALLHKKWILTSAAEFYNVREAIKIFRARLGSVNCKKGGTLVPIKWIEIHPQYIYKEPCYDLAMLRTAVPFEYSTSIQPINLSKVKGHVLSAKYLTTYWSRVIINGKIISRKANERLKHENMRISTQIMTPWDECTQLLKSYNCSLDGSSFCLKPIASHHSPCLPDAGAPIVGDDGLWGITSSWISDTCFEQSSPTIFTRISLPITDSWIDSLL